MNSIESKINRKKQEQLSRRDFLKMGVSALSLVALLEVGGASLLFMKPRSSEGQFGGLVTAGTVDSFPSRSVTEFPDGRFYLVRAADGGFLAVYRRCTHLGCNVNWEAEQNRFFCPCHNGAFNRQGKATAGPPATAGQELTRFPLRVAQGLLYIETPFDSVSREG